MIYIRNYGFYVKTCDTKATDKTILKLVPLIYGGWWFQKKSKSTLREFELFQIHRPSWTTKQILL